VLTGFGISVPLSQPKVNHIDDVLRPFRLKSHQEVVWLNISMKEVVIVQELNALQELIRKHQDCFQTKFSLALSE